jgi:hypothetical protein
VSLDAGAFSDRGDRRGHRTDARVKLYRRMGDPPARLSHALRAALEPVVPLPHDPCTTLCSEDLTA